MRKLLVRLLPAVIGGLLATTALAQNEDEPLPPFYDVPSIEDTKPWFQWIAGVLIVATCLGVAIKDPHRTHLD